VRIRGLGQGRVSVNSHLPRSLRYLQLHRCVQFNSVYFDFLIVHTVQHKGDHKKKYSQVKRSYWHNANEFLV